MPKRSKKAGMQRAAAHAAGYVTGVDAARIVGITYRRVDHAARTGVAPPAVEPKGSGTARGYDLEALVRLKVAADLYGIGVTTRDVEGLAGLLDRVDYDGGPVMLPLGASSVAVLVDPGWARGYVQDGYLEVVGRGRAG